MYLSPGKIWTKAISKGLKRDQVVDYFADGLKDGSILLSPLIAGIDEPIRIKQSTYDGALEESKEWIDTMVQMEVMEIIP